jgi:hypothetical protein
MRTGRGALAAPADADAAREAAEVTGTTLDDARG